MSNSVCSKTQTDKHQESNSVQISLQMWYMVAIILMIFLVTNWRNFVYLLVDPGFLYPLKFLWSIASRSVAPEQILKWGHTSASKLLKNFFGRAPPLFGSKSRISRFRVSAFVVVSTVWSVSGLLFFYSRPPPCCLMDEVGAGGIADTTDKRACPFVLLSVRWSLTLADQSGTSKAVGSRWVRRVPGELWLFGHFQKKVKKLGQWKWTKVNIRCFCSLHC